MDTNDDANKVGPVLSASVAPHDRGPEDATKAFVVRVYGALTAHKVVPYCVASSKPAAIAAGMSLISTYYSSTRRAQYRDAPREGGRIHC
jgi:hypothetical protein